MPSGRLLRRTHSGGGRYADTNDGERARQLAEARHRADEASRFAADENGGWRTRRGWAREAKVWEGRVAAAEKAFEVVAGPELEPLDQTIANLEADQRSLTRAEAERGAARPRDRLRPLTRRSS